MRISENRSTFQVSVGDGSRVLKVAASLLTGSSLGEIRKYFGGTETTAYLSKVEIKTQYWAETMSNG